MFLVKSNEILEMTDKDYYNIRVLITQHHKEFVMLYKLKTILVLSLSNDSYSTVILEFLTFRSLIEQLH